MIKAAAASRNPNYARADVIVYGATPGGVMAALSANRTGASVILVGGWRERHLGGVMSGGLGATDIGNTAAIGGYTRDVFTRINTFLARADNVFDAEPRYFEQIFEDLILNAGIPVFWTNGVTEVAKSGILITRFRTAEGNVFAGKQFIDASYELDLTALAKCTTFVGREVSTVNESVGGFRTTSAQNTPQFTVGATNYTIDPYVTPGAAGSGLIAGVTDMPAGAIGSTDSKVQAYNFRLMITNGGGRRVPFSSSPPPGYSAGTYECLFRWFAAITASGKVFGTDWTLDNLFRKVPVGANAQGTVYDFNNFGPFSSDFVGANYAYPTATYAQREVIRQNHVNYTLGFIYAITYEADSRVPAALKASMLTFGWDANHFLTPFGSDAQYFPYQLYVREARRLVSDYVYRGGDAEAPDTDPLRSTNTIATASYGLDSHIVQRFAATVNGTMQVFNEGGFLLDRFGANDLGPLPYEIIVPKRSECSNLFVTFGVSCTHMAFGGIRMEPTHMAIGEAAGTAAALVARSASGIAVQDLPYAALRSALLGSGSAVPSALSQTN